MKHVPNAVTIFRILLTPVVLLLLFSGTFEGRLLALIIFIVAAVSDWVDGALARAFKVRSRLGQFLDPFADKVLVLGTFMVLPFLLPSVVPWWAVALIAARDVVITGMRTVAESRGRPMPTMQSAKTKTLTQLSFLILVLLLMVGVRVPGQIGSISTEILYSPLIFLLLLCVVAFTVVTGAIYLYEWRRAAIAGNR